VHLEDLARVRAVALDKTGTLTAGKPSVTDVVPVSGRSETDLLAVAAAVETSSQHPLAEGIVRHAKEKAIAVPPATDFRSEQAVGAGASVGGQRVLVGKPSSFQGREGYDTIREAVDRLRTEGKTVVVVGTDVAVYGLIALRDRLRPGTMEALRDLHAAGVERVIMLTGDNRGSAEAIAREAGIDEFHAELMPEDKVRLVRELSARHGGVAMVGDGVNDAPALAAATVGIAMGAAGTGVALETASVALMTDNLARIADALRLARRTRRLVNQNLALSALVISGLALAAVSGYLTLPAAVIAHELSELAVIANGLRILRG
jgi:Cd2+/Zn2+-exporting ATPase